MRFNHNGVCAGVLTVGEVGPQTAISLETKEATTFII